MVAPRFRHGARTDPKAHRPEEAHLIRKDPRCHWAVGISRLHADRPRGAQTGGAQDPEVSADLRFRSLHVLLQHT